jgi:hypothetical protein
MSRRGPSDGLLKMGVSFGVVELDSTNSTCRAA